MNKKLVLMLILGIICLAAASASVSISAERIQNSIYLDEYASYNLTIDNPDPADKTLQVYSADIDFHVELEPSLSSVKGDSNTTMVLKLIPSSVWAEPGAQVVNVVVSVDGENTYMQVPIYIKSYDQGEKKYTPSVELRVDFPNSVDPREEVPIKISLKNRNRLNITEMEIIVDSKLFHSYTVVPLAPFPDGERTENIPYSIDALTPPQEDKLEITLRVANRTINTATTNYEVKGYSSFKQKEDFVEELFKRKRDFTIVNEGNMQKTEPFRVPTSLLDNLFTVSSPKPDKVSLKKDSYLEWDLTLAPMQETRIEVVQNFRPVIYFILLGVIVSLVYFLYRSPVIVRKETIITRTDHDGISEMKVLLHIRNRSQDLIEHIRVSDLVPSLAEVQSEHHIGTIAPSKMVRNDKKGTIIKWDLETLEPFEERIVTYKLKSRIAILGGLTLPPAKIKFETKRGKERNIRSNASQVSMGL